MRIAVLLVAGATQAPACTVPANAPALRAEAQAGLSAERARAGLAGWARSDRLESAAQGHACALARRGQISHRGILGTGLRTRLWRAGYRAALAGENLAAGLESAAAVVAAWMGSPGHRDNILSPGMQEVGLGVARGGDGMLYWVMIAARPG